MTTVNDIRTGFLDYFRRHDHEIVPSSPLVPQNDSTLMFVNAGMVPFKNRFTGKESGSFQRAASSQKCVRAGGKHNDLDNVGFTARHHTFFEMLGNFSFGDYFKEQAILHAWTLITREFSLPTDRLLVTYFAEDDEAARLWRKISGLPESRILPIATSDNFWSMGPTGPCGPSSEIFYDHGDHIAGGPPGSPDEDGDRFVEIWNLVFMQYDQISEQQRVDLPRPSIDTGMGLERIAAVLQGTHDNFEIDLFRTLIDHVGQLTGADLSGAHQTSARVIADHIRSISFLIADGVMPANEGRGYVLRRIMRRAMRHAHMLGSREPVLYRLVPVLAAEMGTAYPELVRARVLIEETLQHEETRFLRTLTRGLDLLEQELSQLPAGRELSGEVAFRLYDTYGFPLDLTEDALRPRGIGVDKTGFDQAMAAQKAEARAAWSGSGDAETEAVWFELKDRFGATEFLGYELDQVEAQLMACVHDGQVVPELKAGQAAALITNQTVFYAESGGQKGDSGVILSPDGARFEVEDTVKKAGGLFVHQGKLVSGQLKAGDKLECRIDAGRRARIRASHSATHLLHEALRRQLGLHVAQKGSLVEPGRLRFDFSHNKPMSADEIHQVEREANEIIRQNTPVSTRIMAQDDAIAAGALALFGEKYGDEVRVVSMGRPAPDQDAASPRKAWSVELCGGTHVGQTGDIGLVKITSESAVAAGIRRVEALTGDAALAYLAEQEARVRQTAALLKCPPDEVITRISALLEERKTLEKALQQAKKAAAFGAADPGADIEQIGPVAVMAKVLPGIPAKELRGLVDEGKQRINSGIVVMIGVSDEGKAGIAVGVTQDLTDRYNAVALVKKAAAILGGKGGGGRPDMAQAGGPDGQKAEQALQALRDMLTSKEAA